MFQLLCRNDIRKEEEGGGGGKEKEKEKEKITELLCRYRKM